MASVNDNLCVITTGVSAMKNFLLLITTTTLLYSGLSLAQSTRYELRVDGLACPFCAYGIEKEFIRTEGVETVDIDMVKGLVIVVTAEGKTFIEEELSEIINNAGFTLKSMTEISN
jgi:mercuric ion binding protein